LNPRILASGPSVTDKMKCSLVAQRPARVAGQNELEGVRESTPFFVSCYNKFFSRCD
jgi:hypothetical protein